jgi:4-hydroxybenzoate polyprenyltransferase
LLINTVIFDALDVKGDAISKVKTIPMALGRKKTKHALLAINSVLLLWIGYCIVYGFFQSYLPALCFGVFYSYAIIWFFTSDRERKRFSAELLVDGEWVSMFIILRSIVR